MGCRKDEPADKLKTKMKIKITKTPLPAWKITSIALDEGFSIAVVTPGGGVLTDHPYWANIPGSHYLHGLSAMKVGDYVSHELKTKMKIKINTSATDFECNGDMNDQALSDSLSAYGVKIEVEIRLAFPDAEFSHEINYGDVAHEIEVAGVDPEDHDDVVDDIQRILEHVYENLLAAR